MVVRLRGRRHVKGPLFRASWQAPALVAAHPPRFVHPNKRVAFDVACPPGAPHAGTVTVSRWPAAALPTAAAGVADTRLVEAPGFYTYDPPAPGTIAWHKNFADPVVFGFYAGGLFAQDEMQITEHPALASVRGALVAAGHGYTAEAGPTPVLVAGVERRCAVDTAPGLERGSIQGLYGNRFAAADPEVVRAATLRLDPPTVSNIVAVAAPHPGSGRYSAADIRAVLVTAYSGYVAMVAESAALAPGAAVVLHTGFWGCGAFGGDRVLMTTLQVLAARWAGVHTLVMHLGDSAGRRAVVDARAVLAALPPNADTDTTIASLVARGFAWGVSDGN